MIRIRRVNKYRGDYEKEKDQYASIDGGTYLQVALISHIRRRQLHRRQGQQAGGYFSNPSCLWNHLPVAEVTVYGL